MKLLKEKYTGQGKEYRIYEAIVGKGGRAVVFDKQDIEYMMENNPQTLYNYMGMILSRMLPDREKEEEDS